MAGRLSSNAAAHRSPTRENRDREEKEETTDGCQHRNYYRSNCMHVTLLEESEAKVLTGWMQQVKHIH